MKTGIVKFYFLKVDGSKREAYGTLSDKIVPEFEVQQPEYQAKKKNDTVQTYFDTEVSAWKCFKKANLISIA
ncbi:hypothetical protein Barb7_00289 [Bacteroidales bacterium Barb7]|nr:hypothetical protein Barb7_00289 [Bacteroidales bacterium Barb7]